MKATDMILIGTVAACLLVLSFFAGVYRGRTTAPVPPAVTVRDTLVIRDTVRVDRPVAVYRRVVERVLVPVTDTITIRDTTYMAVRREQREYADTLYRAWVSGFDPALDSIHVFRRELRVETVRTVTPKPKRWHLGVSAGYGAALLDDGVRMSPYVRVGVTYSIFSF